MMTLKECHDEGKDFARTRIAERGNLVPMFIGFGADDARFAVATDMPEDPGERGEMAALVGALLRSKGSTRYVFMSEIWLSTSANEEGKRTGQAPAKPLSEHADRRDGLSIITCDDQGNAMMAVYEVRKAPGSIVELVQDSPEAVASPGGNARIEGRFTDLLRKADRNLSAATKVLAGLGIAKPAHEQKDLN